MKNKTLSVIIPNFNKGIFLSTLLDSILRQTRLPEEIIVVDDCSTDNSRSILSDYSKKNPIIKLFFLEENRGVQFARNYGASKSTCDYITFIDSDDFYFQPEKLNNEMKYAGINKLVCSRFYFYDNTNGTISAPDYDSRRHKNYLKHQKYYFIMNKNIPFFPYAYIISKKAFFDVGGYDFKYNLFEDVDILIKLKLKGIRFKYLKTYGRAYRINDISTTHLSYVDSQKNIQASKELRRKYNSKIKVVSFYMMACRKIKSYLKKRRV